MALSGAAEGSFPSDGVGVFLAQSLYSCLAVLSEEFFREWTMVGKGSEELKCVG